ncbi:hypothetical protein FACS1894201_00580 [Bacteroidia bacterium]|nr:hypothetical protein FACS1894201_00580 [Bacteroidia bacterium]
MQMLQKNYALTILLWIVILGNAYSQVEIRGLNYNPRLVEQPLPARASTVAATKYCVLPFLEDFSDIERSYPSVERWSDAMVFINNHYPMSPPSLGVATFDGLDRHGYIYPQASIYSFPADTLTSQYIRLDSAFLPTPVALSVADSVYLSFYYQPGGGFGESWQENKRGMAPKPGDMLILELCDSDLQDWNEVWRVDGQNLETFCPMCNSDTAEQEKTYFKQVLIPIVDTRYFRKQFQFRFRNLTSLDETWQSGGGQWHIDYIKLDYDRQWDDTYSYDLCFTEQPGSILKTFTAIPAKQVRKTDFKDSLQIRTKNMGFNGYVGAYLYEIFDGDNDIVYASTRTNANIYPFETHGYTVFTQPLVYNFPITPVKSQNYEIRHYLYPQTSMDIFPQNDAVIHRQDLTNYYAYDDGIPEAGFGLNFANGEFAYRFPLRVKDTLSAVEIYFNHTMADLSKAYVELMVWKALNDSTPMDTAVYISQQFKVTHNEQIGYQSFEINPPLVLDSGLFFIGLRQTSNQFLNIGFDQNNNAEKALYYYDKIVQRWINVFYYGALMMRPVFNAPTSTDIQSQISEKKQLTIYPNPVLDRLNIVTEGAQIGDKIEIFNMQGQCMDRQEVRIKGVETIDVSKLLTGTYILKLGDLSVKFVR